MSAVEIICRNCESDTLLQRNAIYDGFIKSGEKLSCSCCGFEYVDETDVPFKTKTPEPQIFTEEDRSVKPAIFGDNENQRLCRYCANYIINPFTQFCSRHKKEVQATDSCNRFKKSEDKNSDNSPI